MTTVAKFASAGGTGWTNPSNAFADNGIYATAAPGKNQTVTGDFLCAAFEVADIPDGSTINSVTAVVQWKVSTTASVATLGAQLHNPAGTGLGSETVVTAEPTSDQIDTQQVTSGVDLADLRNAGTVVVRVRCSRGNSNTAVTGSLDYVKFTVDFTAPPPEVTLAGTIAGASTVAGAIALVVGLSAASAGVSGMSGALSVDRGLAANVTGQSTVAAAMDVTGLSGDVEMSAAVAGVSGIAAAMAVDRALAGTVAGTSGMSAATVLDMGMSAIVAGASGISAAMASEVSLRATTSAVSNVSAMLRMGDAHPIVCVVCLGGARPWI